jgi:hypothetical protein
MMKLFLGIVVVVVVATVTTVRPAGASPRLLATCLPDTAQYAVTTRNGLADAVAGSTVDDSVFRVVSQLPQAAASEVQIVQADSTCQQAAVALAAAWGSGSSSDNTWVIRVGSTRYVVFNLKQINARRIEGLIFDNNFNYLTAIVL